VVMFRCSCHSNRHNITTSDVNPASSITPSASRHISCHLQLVITFQQSYKVNCCISIMFDSLNFAALANGSAGTGTPTSAANSFTGGPEIPNPGGSMFAGGNTGGGLPCGMSGCQRTSRWFQYGTNQQLCWC